MRLTTSGTTGVWLGRVDVPAAASGLVAAAAALGTSELLAGILAGGGSLIAAVGQVVIDLQPPGAKDFVVALFGTNDKLALEVLVVTVSLAIGALFGVLARHRFELGALGFVAFGGVGFLATLADPLSNPGITIVSAVVAVTVGL